MLVPTLSAGAKPRVIAGSAVSANVQSTVEPATEPFAPIPVAPETAVVTQTTIAATKGQRIAVYATATGTKPKWVLDNRTNFSGRHVFVVIGEEGSSYKVQVPVRPNGSTGYVRVADVATYRHDFAIVVSLGEKRLTLYKGGVPVMRERVAVGKSGTPTPVGTFFLRELARPPNPGGAYGPWAFGLSGYSNVLQTFGRGDGQIGLHGTNRPDQLGTQASHGCIRIRNAAIIKLAKTLPQGVPIDVRV